ncbi:glycoside hydrolase family 5 protein [Actinopolyspora mortivallis]|uniref:Beta-mannanase n=1 Tax=Actinopolyspora mortivallis TaxID=33906 RepID=A0A2T0GX02_ACTMO|nr:glycoside hydrolase family 5 protein [Actinopolyspora mortivallis]PRW63632.1 beta-mannanase [Actinopolyspora mortivallis]
MKTRLRVLGTALAVLALSLATTLSQATADTPHHRPAPEGFHVRDGRLLDANDNDFVMRGVNHPHTWYPDQTQSLSDIKSLGANTVRVVLSSGHQWTRNDTADVAEVVADCKRNRLICVLEVHDTTGYGDQGGRAATLDQAVDYWLSVREALRGEEEYVVVNIGNEPFGNSTHSQWTSATSEAIQRMRSAGFEHTLMVDAPNWGQDWRYTMRDDAASVFADDPLRNTVFSVHMYGVFGTGDAVRDYLWHFVEEGLPIVVGEFGHKHSDGDVAESAILSAAESFGIGYLGWSWSGNSGGVEYLDMTEDFDPNRLTPWGQRLFNGENGIRETSREASVY